MSNIEIQSMGLQCDSESCDYIDYDYIQDQIESYINKPCPKCGENLLTEQDYKNQMLLLNLISLVNVFDVPHEKKVPAIVTTHKNIEISVKVGE